MTNFNIDTRFDFDQREVISRLLEAPGIAGRPFTTRRPESKHRMLLRAVRHPRAELSARITRLLYRDRSRSSALANYCALVEELTGQPLRLEDRGAFFLWTHGDDAWLYPASREKCFFFGFLTAVDPARWLGAKYTLPGFLELEADDVVIDCGAFSGGFARAALRVGASVTAVEPSRTNRTCLEANLQGSEVDIQPVGLGQVSGRVAFRESSTGLDSTFGQIDEGITTGTYEVEMLTVDELCRRSGEPPSFLKVEAEGLELSILAGMEETRPAKVAVDASPEGGHNERDAIARHLQTLGYTVRTDINMVYARR